ncbi:MAG: Uncharacterized protein G01um101418_402 [Parcubacteria group bacterium Gr01-1014_18]|nr:MAG: Uncharacterized protein Greene041636_352 [Parcubacteria group bacterium Greene0416_36]TSC81123.1 MAG: Uncharacterized protein G01um101418_402 [Parcubacteria group bacterium Gr01-1014_18]TSC98460.1 MAG: Uncharacterized protein Greene101420_697 [Parcubacteria group bacterium Greene1014_20]TSD07374.1 MAG: Uncharacterized protein Greene07142_229 [Parcubacteria group bacterium Greene0714_2]
MLVDKKERPEGPTLKVGFLATKKEYCLSVFQKIYCEARRFFRSKKNEEGDTIESMMRGLHREDQEIVRYGNKFFLNPFLGAFRQARSFFVLCVWAVVPILLVSLGALGVQYWSDLRGSTVQAARSFKEGVSNLSMLQRAQASSFFQDSGESFSRSRDLLEEVKMWARGASLLGLESGNQYSLGDKAVRMGESASLAAVYFSSAFGKLEGAEMNNLLPSLEESSRDYFRGLEHVRLLQNIMDSIDASRLPGALASDWDRFSALGREGLLDLEKLGDVISIVPEILGKADKKRYLIIFHNNSEMRPTGGFMGSFALVDIVDGKISEIEVPGGGPYDLRAGFNETILPPEPLSMVSSRWEFQDANWFGDWPTSAEKIKWFYEKSGGPTVDGVIGVNTFLFRDILEIVGSIPMPEYGKVISADNFLEEIQTQVELEYDRLENKPKQLIADLTPVVTERIMGLSQGDQLRLLSVLNRAWVEKNLFVYFVNPVLERHMVELGLAGEMKSSNRDYLMIVRTNLASSKTDRVIDENIELTSKISAQGHIVNEINLYRTHQGTPGDIFTGMKNISYFRFYVPEGATLISAEGFSKPEDFYFFASPENAKADLDLALIEKNERFDSESGTRLTEELGKTVFGNWIQTGMGETSHIRLVYELPIKLDVFSDTSSGGGIESWKRWIHASDADSMDHYSLYYQKQLGAWDSTFSYDLIVDPIWNVASFYPSSWNRKGNNFEWSGLFDRDTIWSLLVQKN